MTAETGSPVPGATGRTARRSYLSARRRPPDQSAAPVPAAAAAAAAAASRTITQHHISRALPHQSDGSAASEANEARSAPPEPLEIDDRRQRHRDQTLLASRVGQLLASRLPGYRRVRFTDGLSPYLRLEPPPPPVPDGRHSGPEPLHARLEALGGRPGSELGSARLLVTSET